jgi:hypothetical protein
MNWVTLKHDYRNKSLSEKANKQCFPQQKEFCYKKEKCGQKLKNEENEIVRVAT